MSLGTKVCRVTIDNPTMCNTGDVCGILCDLLLFATIGPINKKLLFLIIMVV